MVVKDSENRVTIFMHPEYHKKLMDMSFKRSAELGRRVSMGFVVQEMIDREEQMENPDQRSADLFASQD
jgi:hypothetical protein